MERKNGERESSISLETRNRRARLSSYRAVGGNTIRMKTKGRAAKGGVGEFAYFSLSALNAERAN